MPFRLKNAPQSFQRLMDRFLADILHAFVYLDDILISTPDVASDLTALWQVFKVLDSNSLAINFSKCNFLKEELTFFGHKVSETERPRGCHQVNTTTHDPQGALQFPAQPLTECIKGNPKELDWSTPLQQSFDTIKAALAATTLLVHPLPHVELSLATEASNTHIGGVLQQKELKGCSHWDSGECKYSAFDRELLAAFKSIRHFRFALEGHHFQL